MGSHHQITTTARAKLPAVVPLTTSSQPKRVRWLVTSQFSTIKARESSILHFGHLCARPKCSNNNFPLEAVIMVSLCFQHFSPYVRGCGPFLFIKTSRFETTLFTPVAPLRPFSVRHARLHVRVVVSSAYTMAYFYKKSNNT